MEKAKKTVTAKTEDKQSGAGQGNTELGKYFEDALKGHLLGGKASH